MKIPFPLVRSAQAVKLQTDATVKATGLGAKLAVEQRKAETLHARLVQAASWPKRGMEGSHAKQKRHRNMLRLQGLRQLQPTKLQAQKKRRAVNMQWSDPLAYRILRKSSIKSR